MKIKLEMMNTISCTLSAIKEAAIPSKNGSVPLVQLRQSLVKISLSCPPLHPPPSLRSHLSFGLAPFSATFQNNVLSLCDIWKAQRRRPTKAPKCKRLFMNN